MSHLNYVMTQKRPQEKYCYQSFIGQPLDVDLYDACKEKLKQFFYLKNIAFDAQKFDIHEFRRNCQETQYNVSHSYSAFKSAINRHGLFSLKANAKPDVSVHQLYQLGGKLDNNQALWELNQFLTLELQKLNPQNFNQASNQRRRG